MSSQRFVIGELGSSNGGITRLLENHKSKYMLYLFKCLKLALSSGVKTTGSAQFYPVIKAKKGRSYTYTSLLNTPRKTLD